jgi:hypothetical protein
MIAPRASARRTALGAFRGARLRIPVATLATATLLALLAVPAGPACAADPLRVLFVELEANRDALEHATIFEQDFRTAISRKKDVELIDEVTTRTAIRRSGVEHPIPFEDAVLRRIGEAAGADVVLYATMERQPFYDLVTGAVVSVETGERLKYEEEFCRCRTVEGREMSADDLAERLFGSGIGLPDRGQILRLGAAAIVAGGLVALMLNMIEPDDEGPPELPGLPGPPE